PPGRGPGPGLALAGLAGRPARRGVGGGRRLPVEPLLRLRRLPEHGHRDPDRGRAAGPLEAAAAVGALNRRTARGRVRSAGPGPRCPRGRTAGAAEIVAKRGRPGARRGRKAAERARSGRAEGVWPGAPLAPGHTCSKTDGAPEWFARSAKNLEENLGPVETAGQRGSGWENPAGRAGRPRCRAGRNATGGLFNGARRGKSIYVR